MRKRRRHASGRDQEGERKRIVDEVVNGTPKLTPWRHLKSDPLGGLVDLCWIFWFWCPGRRGGSGMVVSVLAGGGRNAPHIAVFKPVALPFKRENLRVMD